MWIRPCRLMQLDKVRAHVFDHGLAEQRMGSRFRDSDGQNLPDLPRHPLEDHDPVADGPPANCATGPSVPRLRLVLLGPSTRTSTVRPTNGWLSSSLIAFWIASSSLLRRRLTSSGTSSGYRSAALVPGRGLYLKMKLFLKRHSRHGSTVCWKSSSVSPQKPTMKSLEPPRRARSRGSVPSSRDTPRPCSPVSSAEHCVRAALGRHVQVGRTLGQVADRLRAGRRSCPWG